MRVLKCSSVRFQKMPMPLFKMRLLPEFRYVGSSGSRRLLPGARGILPLVEFLPPIGDAALFGHS